MTPHRVPAESMSGIACCPREGDVVGELRRGDCTDQTDRINGIFEARITRLDEPRVNASHPPPAPPEHGARGTRLPGAPQGSPGLHRAWKTYQNLDQPWTIYMVNLRLWCAMSKLGSKNYIFTQGVWASQIRRGASLIPKGSNHRVALYNLYIFYIYSIQYTYIYIYIYI